MKNALLVLALGLASVQAMAWTPSEDVEVKKYYTAFKDAKGQVWDMKIDDNVYFDCDLYSAESGNAEVGFMAMRVTLDGLSHKINRNLTKARFDGMTLTPTKDEVFGRRGKIAKTKVDNADPLELLAIRVGKPISIENPYIDKYKEKNTPAERTIMSRPLYLEISKLITADDDVTNTLTVKPLSTEAKKDARYKVKEYGVCYFSKFNSQLNNSGLGYPGNTRDAWSETAIWGAHSSPERAY